MKYTKNNTWLTASCQTKKLTTVAMSTAIIAALSQISLPVPPVPITLQTFALALTACVAGPKLGFCSAALYLVCGAAGIPVFAGFHAGPASLAGYSGGFLLAFPAMSFLSGLSCRFHKYWKLLPMLAGLVVCHGAGTLWYAHLTGVSMKTSAYAVSLPFLIKDIVSIAAALHLSSRIKTALARCNLFPLDQ